MTQPRWLSVGEVLRLHAVQIQRFGGKAGVRDRGLLESAILRPMNKHHYQATGDIVDLAAEYAIAITSNSPRGDLNSLPPITNH